MRYICAAVCTLDRMLCDCFHGFPICLHFYLLLCVPPNVLPVVHVAAIPPCLRLVCLRLGVPPGVMGSLGDDDLVFGRIRRQPQLSGTPFLNGRWSDIIIFFLNIKEKEDTPPSMS